MHNIYKDIILAKQKGKKLLAILLDPDKLSVKLIKELVTKINESPATHIFVGGSTVAIGETEKIVTEIKKHSKLPILLFPGDASQITNTADGLLFLSLLSGNNPEYLITQQIKSASSLKNSDLEIIPTGYILVDGGVETAVQRVSKTLPISQSDSNLIVDTALAGQYMGKQLIYLEAGSGATLHVEANIIGEVSAAINVPLIVGGGLRCLSAIQNTYRAGADLVVIGTAFEEDETFFEK